MSPILRLLRRWSRAVGEEIQFRSLLGAASVLRALPSRWVLSLADRLGALLYLQDARGRSVGRENLRIVFGEDLPEDEIRRILEASFRSILRSVLLMFHASPMTRKRFLKWVDVPAGVEARFRQVIAEHGTGVVVSGHLGSWEFLLGLPNACPYIPSLAFLTQGLSTVALDRFFDAMRGSGGGAPVRAAGGARALHTHVKAGGAAALLVDRNVRRKHGGIWAPFLGLEARTTPLAAWLCLKDGVPVVPMLCLPIEGGRYRIHIGDDLDAGVPRDDPEVAMREITTRANEWVGRYVRERPEIWNWTLKRFKSRPTEALGDYPAYSEWDPD